MNQGPIWGRLLKKTRGRQSRATVPLRVTPSNVGDRQVDIKRLQESTPAVFQRKRGFGKRLEWVTYELVKAD